MNREEYWGEFSDPDSERCQKIHAALERAHDMRKFEIDLYWRRAAHFWVFIAAIFAAYFAVYASDAYFNSTGKNPSHYLLYVLGLLGYFTSFCWYLVNRGSKHWQANWEAHIDMLENKVTGPLYKLVLESDENENFWRPSLHAYPFSVSKLNMIVSILFCIAWLAIVILTPFNRGLVGCGLCQAGTSVIMGTLIVVGTRWIQKRVVSSYTRPKGEKGKGRDFYLRPLPLPPKDSNES